jgi:AcrR family transcriptional regulator
MTTTPKPRRSRNREATQQALLDACGRLLLRDGPDGIGVNNVVSEAGVGKDLIYRYFGGLPGLIQAWVESDANWPDTAELLGDDPQVFAELTLEDKIKRIQHNYLRALRARPVIMRIMASELMHPTAVTAALESASGRIGSELETIVADLGEADKEAVVSLSLVFYTMLNYLCMRAVTSPQCYGMDLTKDESWDRVQRILDEVIERYLR